ncbi:hypothetical protein JMUB3936_1141 [Leptotrichia wadei]|jgi:hypothetical protein|uniref:Uncharacterized protein n=1 Tax=Leptotrichia wadei TaxID=157687 RepID=A0A510KUD1_9FUSO|nr:hypothetical protein [Leptotrichia wadei]BBM54857.1 hypothetical protein JMUB3936_1141 [Leptotrichia wadei]
MNKYELKEKEWKLSTCDRYDFMIAGFSGAIAGIIDVFFVGNPSLSKLGSLTDDGADELVKKFAKVSGWKPKIDNENNVASAIGFLEGKFRVNYDQRNTTDVNKLFKMGTKNHHIKSLSHSPDIIGLFFSILNQFTSTATFVSEGKIFNIDTSDGKFELKGNNFIEKLFCGFCNWIGHIMSDLSGSSGGRGKINAGRGSGIPIPFMELFLMCDFGKFQNGNDRQTLAVTMTRVFQEGYDARFGVTMSIPVLIQELMIRSLWVIKKRYFEKKDWKECIPTEKHGDLRLMLLIGYTTFCLIDGIDAGLRSGGNMVQFILHLNYVAWVRLIMLVFKELIIRYGPYIKEYLDKFLYSIFNTIKNLNEQKLIKEFYERIQKIDREITKTLYEFIQQVQEEYKQRQKLLIESFSKKNNATQQMIYSVEYAKIMGVSKEKIIYSVEELDELLKK